MCFLLGAAFSMASSADVEMTSLNDENEENVASPELRGQRGARQSTTFTWRRDAKELSKLGRVPVKEQKVTARVRRHYGVAGYAAKVASEIATACKTLNRPSHSLSLTRTHTCTATPPPPPRRGTDSHTHAHDAT